MDVQPVSFVTPPSARTRPSSGAAGQAPTRPLAEGAGLSAGGRALARRPELPDPALYLGKQGPPFLARGPLGPVWVNVRLPTFDRTA